ncbi:RPOLA_N domain-containing protein [Trichonephila clavipes]|nr:RPOLA_N domain-containing protein [Trichonephila clavipes]
MSVEQYSFSILSFKDCPVQKTPEQVIELLKAWRKEHPFADKCSVCKTFLPPIPYTLCCGHFYYNNQFKTYPVQSFAVQTPKYAFELPILKRLKAQAKLKLDQDFLVLPDPIFWQVVSTLVYEKIMKFVQGLPMTSRTQTVQSPSKVGLFYKQILEVPLNYGSLQRRSCGKSTLIRQVAFGKRCILSMRGMIVPDASLRPNQIQLPTHVVKKFNIQNQWIILNRMPSLQPGNFIALKVSSPGWEYDCFGIPLEVVQAMNADFDGDECNLYLVPNVLSQAECATILNPESQLGCFVMQGPKLTPTQDMLVVYFVKFKDIHFLPYKQRDLSKTFQVLYDCYGSQQAFEYIDQMRQFYLDVLQRQMCFALTLQEMQTLYEWGREPLEEFQQKAETSKGCLVTQVLSGAKGSFEHLYQMFGSIGYQNDVFVKHSFWEGLRANEAVVHAKTATEALSNASKIGNLDIVIIKWYTICKDCMWTTKDV